ncbi:MAG: exodeoxyribonuclease V subunit gamma, partial [Actinobacteria bacterium]|nr:exodeoxyribonuclease V subunit gamma [Actinomycetota bacterium]
MLHIHRAERADGLADALGDVLDRPLEDPLAAEVVAVPTRGVERWLAQRLSSRLGAGAGRSDGVCANIDFPFPGRVVGGAVAAAAGIDRDADPWLPERAVWPLLDVVDECLDEPWLAPLAAHLRAGGPAAEADGQGRRFASIRHIADLYDRYGVHRPEMLRTWAGGHDSDGADGSLAPDVAWQAELWRRLRDRMAVPSPAERLAGACERLRADAGLADLPPRVSLFGLTRLPRSYLQVLGALGVGRHVHLFLLHPSPALWSSVAAATRDRPPIVRRGDDVTATMARNPLLASWGQDAREMQLVLGAGDTAPAAYHHPVDQPATTLLGRIQADIRADRCPPGVPLPGQGDSRPLLDPEDRSVQVHACHGPARQVEVVRDAILHLLAEDETLEARHIIVMCPDIETFAPLVHATFGAGDVTGSGDNDDGLTPDLRPPDLRVRLADRSLRRTNPLLAVVAEVLDLASARLTAAEVLDLAGREPVRRRFGLDDDDLARLEEWAAATGVRWGLDADHRAPYGLDWLEANTWRAGLDRVLLGVAVAEEGQRLVGGVLPLDDVGSGDIDLAGRVAELVDRLHASVTALSRPQTVDAWAEAIAAAADELTDTAEGDAWQRVQLRALLDDVVTEAGAEGRTSAAVLGLADIRSLLGDRLRGRPTRANFRTGHLTVCTLVPMRSVPHRVVCLMGLDDGVFPRRAARDGDDIILNDPRVGDRDARSEDRQLLLDALLAATDRLVVTYAGRDERNNAERPPAVPVGELLDVVDRTARTDETAGDGSPLPARTRVVVHHPLQPFDARNFTTGALVPRRVWSFDPVALAGARATSDRRRGTSPFLAGPLPDPAGNLVELEQLVHFVQHPVRAFLRQRLGVSLSDRSGDIGRALPVELDPLERWAVGQRLLEARLGGAGLGACLRAEEARGILPPGALGQAVLDGVVPSVEEVVRAAAPVVGGPGEPASTDVDLRLPDGRSLVGTVPGVRGDLLGTVTYSRVGARHRLAAWVRLLALTASHPRRRLKAVTVGRCRSDGPQGGRVTVARLPPLPGDP